MNTNLDKLLPYPFERLADLLAGVQPNFEKEPIRWSIGEPTHESPQFVKQVLIHHLDGLSNYPMIKGMEDLREAIAQWLVARFSLPADAIDADKHILPVLGTREALFSFAHCVVTPSTDAVIAMPNPFYQIYEGAAIMAGATPFFMNLDDENDFLPDFSSVRPDTWKRCQLLYVCSPNNPTGSCFSMQNWHALLDLSERYNFVIASDECYSEVYTDEAKPPIGLLEAASKKGVENFKNCVVFHSLSKRSNLPGLRSGFVAGDPELIEKYRLYRTYHGCSMPPPVQKASTAAWLDEEHVKENRKLYREKFNAVLNILELVDIDVIRPQGAFYLWPRVEISDTEFAKRLYQEENLLVLPGSYLSRDTKNGNPGTNRLRMALVAPLAESIEGAERLAAFINRLD